MGPSIILPSRPHDANAGAFRFPCGSDNAPGGVEFLRGWRKDPVEAFDLSGMGCESAF